MSKLITENDLKNVLNKVLPASRFGAIYSASWIASSSSANNVALTNDITIPAGNYVLVCYSPVATTDFSIGVAGHYKKMNTDGDSFASIYSCNQTVTFHASSAQSASVSFSYIERGGLYAIQICDANSNTNIADYIVEEGTEGIWTYRKWANGNIELWGRHSETLSNYTTALNGYGYYTTISLPFTVYTPVINYSVQISSGFAIPGSALGYAGSASLSSFNVYAIANVSGSQSTVWVCDVKGKWK